LNELEHAADMKDGTRLADLAHRMRPSLRMLGIRDALGPVDELVANSTTDTTLARAPGLVAALRRIVEEAMEDLIAP
jgi:hypothetical protein